MYLDQLQLKNFRNFKELSIKYSPNVNIFLGQNAQGKTNLLEAIYFLALTRSHRTNNDRDLITFGKKKADLQGHVKKSQVEVELHVRLSPKGKKVWINHIEQSRLSKYVGQLNAILFSPEDLALIKGSPTIRRKFMDLEFGQINEQYLYFASQYRKVLQQKNNYLRQIVAGKTTDKVFLDVLSDQLAGIAAEIIIIRQAYINKLNRYAKEAYQAISDNSEELQVIYVPSTNEIKAESSTEDIYHKLLQIYENNQDKEIRKGTTLFGPHRDDIQFLLNNRDAHLYASQGQQRTIALSLKLAEVQLVFELTHEYPLLLLDDVMSELDKKRQAALLKYIHGKTQTFITTTDLAGISQEIIASPKIFTLDDGKVTEREEING